MFIYHLDLFAPLLSCSESTFWDGEAWFGLLLRTTINFVPLAGAGVDVLLKKVTLDFLRKKKQKIPKVRHSWNTFVNVKL